MEGGRGRTGSDDERTRRKGRRRARRPENTEPLRRCAFWVSGCDASTSACGDRNAVVARRWYRATDAENHWRARTDNVAAARCGLSAANRSLGSNAQCDHRVRRKRRRAAATATAAVPGPSPCASVRASVSLTCARVWFAVRLRAVDFFSSDA